MKKIILATLLFGNLISAAAENNYPGFPSLCYEIGNSHAYLGLSSEHGTHRSGAGFNGQFLTYTDFSLLSMLPLQGINELSESIGFYSKIDALFFEKDFGIPGEKFTGELNLSAMYSAGAENELFSDFPMVYGNRQHNFRFGYTGYLCTDSTSQITGQLDYTFINKRSVFMMNYENDTMLFYLTDSYRTAAFKLSWLYALENSIIGCSLGFTLWAGERKNLWGFSNDGDFYISDEAGRENTVTFISAGEYAADVVYLSFIYDNYILSFGYDSELFKQYIHNSIHYVLDDVLLPIFDRPDRFYISFKFGFPDDII